MRKISTMTSLAALLLMGACGGSDTEDKDNQGSDTETKAPATTVSDQAENGMDDEKVMADAADHGDDEDHAHGDDHEGDDHEGDDHEEGMRSAGGAHVHGLGELAVAVTDGGIEINLQSPMYNLVGFERDPQNEDEETALTDALNTLEFADALFTFPGDAGCQSMEVDYTILQGEAHGDDMEHDHDHDHDGEEHDSDVTGGRDLDATWVWACDDVSALDDVEVKLFDAFSNFEEIDAIALGPDGTNGASLTPTQTTLNLPN